MASEESYSQWVKRTVSRKNASKEVISLFDSTVPEPTYLIADLVANGFQPPVSSRYTSAFANGNPYVVDWLCSAYGVSPAGVICTSGASSALSLLYRGLAEPGDHVLIESPSLDLFQDLARYHALEVGTFTRKGQRFEIDVDEVERLIMPSTRLIVLSNLHNPSGQPIPDPTLRRLADLAERRDLVLLVDEVYGDFADPATRPQPAATLSRRTVSISSLSKNLGLNSLRCGWAIGDAELLANVRALADRVEFGVSNLAHAVAALVLDNRAAFDDYARSTMAQARAVFEPIHRSWLDEGLIEGEMPEFGCIAFPRLVGISDTRAFSEWLFQNSGVVVAPGEYFGAPGYVRIGFVDEPSRLNRGMELLRAGLLAYQGTFAKVSSC